MAKQGDLSDSEHLSEYLRNGWQFSGSKYPFDVGGDQAVLS